MVILKVTTLDNAMLDNVKNLRAHKILCIRLFHVVNISLRKKVFKIIILQYKREATDQSVFFSDSPPLILGLLPCVASSLLCLGP